MTKKIDNDSIADGGAVPLDDDALSAPLSEQAVSTIDALAPQDFDFAGWLSGVQPIHRSVTVYAREDLRAQLDELASLEQVTHDSQREPIIAEAIAITEQIKASGMTFVIEGRTPTWCTAYQSGLSTAGVIDPQEAMLRQIAEQVVGPVTTYEDLLGLMDHREDIITALLGRMLDANAKPGSLNPRFLLGASA